MKDSDNPKYYKEKSKNEGLDRSADKHDRAGGGSNDRSAFANEDFASKRPKFSLGSDTMKGESWTSANYYALNCVVCPLH